MPPKREEKPDAAITSRFAQCVDTLGSQGKAAKQLGVSQPGLWKWLNGTGWPTFELVARAARLADVSLDWIATGRPALAPSNQVLLPMRAVTLKGELVTAPDEDWPQMPFRRDYLEHYGADPEASFVMMVTDADASPRIAPTDLIVIDGAARDLSADGLYAFIRRQRLMLLSVRAKLDGGVVLSRGSDTEELEAPDVTKLTVLGRVRLMCAHIG